MSAPNVIAWAEGICTGRVTPEDIPQQHREDVQVELFNAKYRWTPEKRAAVFPRVKPAVRDAKKADNHDGKLPWRFRNG